MIGMVMGDEDVADTLARCGCENSRQMVIYVRAWIDHTDLAATDDIGAGAQIGERPWIVGHDPPDQG